MRIAYAKRAISDLRNISRYDRDSCRSAIAAAIEARIREVIKHLARGVMRIS